MLWLSLWLEKLKRLIQLNVAVDNHCLMSRSQCKFCENRFSSFRDIALYIGIEMLGLNCSENLTPPFFIKSRIFSP